mmetsp:Transcript_13174/g.23893  ORF Transcript_13174/g.23893 Transcript_13174/m.23893 type:complete len:239 (+) Transcript_13174:603-1319(+)
MQDNPAGTTGRIRFTPTITTCLAQHGAHHDRQYPLAYIAHPSHSIPHQRFVPFICMIFNDENTSRRRILVMVQKHFPCLFRVLWKLGNYCRSRSEQPRTIGAIISITRFTHCSFHCQDCLDICCFCVDSDRNIEQFNLTLDVGKSGFECRIKEHKSWPPWTIERIAILAARGVLHGIENDIEELSLGRGTSTAILPIDGAESHGTRDCRLFAYLICHVHHTNNQRVFFLVDDYFPNMF